MSFGIVDLPALRLANIRFLQTFFFTILKTQTASGTKHSRVLLKRLTLCEHSYREDNQCSMPRFKMFLEIIIIAEIDMVCTLYYESRIQGDWK